MTERLTYMKKETTKVNGIKEILFSFMMLTIGATVAAFAIEEFLAPNNIMDGGIVGVSMIVDNFIPIPLSVITIVLNIPFLIVGYKQLGKLFLAKTAYAMLIFSIMLQVFLTFRNATKEELLATVFGGVILGIGVGLVIRYGGCLDGTETVAILLSKKNSLSVGQIVLMFNVVIYGAVGILFGLDRAMYSLLTYFITSKVIDMVEIGMDQAKAVMIITNEGKRIADSIYKRLGRTVTMLEGEGLISGKKVVLYCVVTRIELSELKRIIQEDDASAFMTISDVSEIVGKHIKKNDEKLESVEIE